jgi:hypothetical protein
MSNTSIMELGDYKKAFAQARADLEKLLEQREEIDRQISKVKQAIIGLAPLAEESGLTGVASVLARSFAEAGVTDAIREILKSSQKPLTPLEVKERLIQMKPSAIAQSNIMASIHTVLKRLVPKEARSFTDKQGEVVYQWIFPRQGLYELIKKAAAKQAKANEGIIPGLPPSKDLK